MKAGQLEPDASRWLRLAQTESTNRLLLEGTFASGMICVAQEQTAGRGRHGRTWHNSAGRSLLFSGLLCGVWQSADPQFRLLPFLAAAALVEALVEFSRAHRLPGSVGIKWPNDIVLSGAESSGKLAGILVESRISAGPNGQAEGRIVVGVGLNWQALPAATLTEQRAACLFGPDVRGVPDPEELLSVFVARWNTLVVRSPGDWLDVCRKYDYLQGKRIRLASGDFTAVGLRDDGALLLRDQNGAVVGWDESSQSIRILEESYNG